MITADKIKPNEKQQLAIDTLKGQIMLLAGPGTGKTFTIIQRIEKMLSEGINPSSILCLTFSDAAANEMKQRLIKKMGVKASSVDIYTYHSFCNEIIKTYPEQFELSEGVHLITDTEKLTIIKECIDEANLQSFVPTRADKYYFSKDFVSHIEKLKMKRLTKEDYLSYIDTNPNLMPELKRLEDEIYEREQRGKTNNKTRYDKVNEIKVNIEKAKELWTLYELYTNKMICRNLIDFSDMIIFVLDVFERNLNFLKEISNKYEYFLVDEYQDTNDLQNNILFNLLDGNKEKNILVVGDDDQIIYGFQGARIDNIENFLNRYPETEVICLEENNRSTQSILDFSYEVITQDSTRLENNEKFKEKNISKKLIAKNKNITEKDKQVRRWHFGETIQEINYIADDIEKLISSEKCPVKNGEKNLSEIAIIAKKRAELYAFMELLKNKNIPCQIDEGKSIFSIRSSILVYFYLKALNNHLLSSDKLFGLMLSEPFKIDLEDYNKILYEQRLNKENQPKDFVSLMGILNNWKTPEKIDNFLTTFNELKEYSASHGLRNTIIEILNRTGILKTFYQEEKNRMENISGIKKIVSEATDFENANSTCSLSDFVQYLDDCWNNDIEISTDKSGIIQNAVQLTTYHGSKGREFEYVYLPNLISKNWEKFKMPNEYKLIVDETPDKEIADKQKYSSQLKLLFVGITRAKHSLTISFADMNNGKAQQITQYLANFADYDFENKEFEYTEENNFVDEFVKSVTKDVYDNQKAFENEIKSRINNFVLSPSSLNTYLNCPRQFFYNNIFKIEVSDANWDNANFGLAIHKILENAVKVAQKEKSYPDIEEIKINFIKEMDNKVFTTKAKKEKFLELGANAIENYYPIFSQIPADRIENIEQSFDGVEVDGEFIKGTIDRIEKNQDGTYSLYDYKTGEPVNENKIEAGQDKENYYNQLCFYKYAYEKMTGKVVSQVGIIYVEKPEKSVYKVLNSDDTAYIEEKIKETYANIKSMKFNPIKEDSNNACKYCGYKQFCRLNII